MRNNLLGEWMEDIGYFSTLAILSEGPLHPGGMQPNTLLGARLDWKDVQVLDLGAGTGVSHRFFTALGARVLSVEPNEWMRRAALRAGVHPREIVAMPAEELTGEWLAENLQGGRLLVQGVAGFLEGGLQTLGRIMMHPSVDEVVIVDWIGAGSDHGSAPVRHTYRAADYLAAVEEAGFLSICLETFNYAPPDNCLELGEASKRVTVHFPEAQQLDWSEVAAQKMVTISLPVTARKDYLILVARKSRGQRAGC